MLYPSEIFYLTQCLMSYTICPLSAKKYEDHNEPQYSKEKNVLKRHAVSATCLRYDLDIETIREGS